jgi:tetratricopeptide (TPR) repeat protein
MNNTRLPLFAMLAALSLAASPAVLPATASPPQLSTGEQKTVFLAQQAIADKNYARAQQLLKAFLKNHPQDVHYLVPFTLGNAMLMAGDPAAAIPCYRTAIKRYPSDPAVWQNLGKACYDALDYAAAADALSRAHDLADSGSPSLAYQAAVAYILAQKPKAALPLLEGPAAGVGDDLKADRFDALMKVYLDLERHDDALALVRESLAGDGNQERLWKILADIYINRRDYQNAAAALEIRASLTPPQPDDIRLLGNVYRMARIPLLAARQYETLIPQDARPGDYENASAAYMAAHCPEKAADVLKQGLTRHSGPGMWWLLGNVLYAQEDYRNAFDAYEKCIAEKPEKAEAHLMMGYCALQTDRPETARKCFSKALPYPEQRAESEKMIRQIDRYYSAALKKAADNSLN